jgi:hypothetical protein
MDHDVYDLGGGYDRSLAVEPDQDSAVMPHDSGLVAHEQGDVRLPIGVLEKLPSPAAQGLALPEYRPEESEDRPLITGLVWSRARVGLRAAVLLRGTSGTHATSWDEDEE